MSQLNVFRGSRYQRGHGIGGALRGLIRAAAPIVKEAAVKLGRATVRKGLATANDMLKGKTFSDAFRENVLQKKRTSMGNYEDETGMGYIPPKKKPRRIKRKKTRNSNSLRARPSDILGD